MSAPRIHGSLAGTIAARLEHGDGAIVEASCMPDGAPRLARLYGRDFGGRPVALAFDLETGEETSRLLLRDTPHAAFRGALLRDGRWLVGFGAGLGGAGPFIEAWDLEAGMRVWHFALPARWEPVSCVPGDLWFAVRTMGNAGVLARIDEPSSVEAALASPLDRTRVPESIAAGDRAVLVRSLSPASAELIDPERRATLAPLTDPRFRAAAAAFLPDGTLVSVSNSRELGFFTASGVHLETRALPGPCLLRSLLHGALVTSPTASLVSGRECVRPVPELPPLSVSQSRRLIPDRAGAHWLLVGTCSVSVRDADARPRRAWDRARSPIGGIRIEPSGRVATRDGDGIVRVFAPSGDVGPGAPFGEPNPRHVAPDGSTRFVSYWDGDTTTGVLVGKGGLEHALPGPVAHDVQWLDVSTLVYVQDVESEGDAGSGGLARFRVVLAPAPCVTQLDEPLAVPQDAYVRLSPSAALVIADRAAATLTCVAAPDLWADQPGPPQIQWTTLLCAHVPEELEVSATHVAVRGGSRVVVFELAGGARVLDIDLDAEHAAALGDLPLGLALLPDALVIGTFRGLSAVYPLGAATPRSNVGDAV